MATFNDKFRDTLVGRTILHISSSNTALKHLQQVNIICSCDDRPLPLHGMRDVLRLPSLRRIRGYNVDLYHLDDFEELMLSSPHPNMKEICLERSFVAWERSMETLLRVNSGLETLSIENGGPDTNEEAIDDYSYIGDTLRKHGTKLLSLEVLRSDFDEDETLWREPLGSLVVLRSLTSLALSYDALYGGEPQSNTQPTTWLQKVLPPSLESLDINHVVHTEPTLLDEQVKALIGDKRFNRLSYVRIGSEHVHFLEKDVPDGWQRSKPRKPLVLSKIGASEGGE